MNIFSHLKREILSRAGMDEELRLASLRDPLTGFPNRSAVLGHITGLLAQSANANAPSFALFLIDLDRFALINDSLGHSVGDDVLVMVAQRIADRLPFSALVGRLGGDEFAICAEIEDDRSAELLARDVGECIQLPITMPAQEITITGSIGVVANSRRYRDAETMLRDAEIAMYAAKQGGSSKHVVFRPEMQMQARSRASLEQSIRRAIDNGEFGAHYQPIIDVASGKVVAIEALARWTRDGELVPTPEFILAAEHAGLIGAIDAQILKQACHDVGQIEDVAPGVVVSVNASATLLSRDDLVLVLSETLEDAELDPSRLQLELTETAFVQHPAKAMKLLQLVRAMGAAVVIDDFGTGYSSLSYVQRLPITGLKIDRSFITPITHEKRSFEIVRAIVTLAHALGVSVTAEGVETYEQLVILRQIGVERAQGWYFAKALPLTELIDFIAKHDRSLYGTSASISSGSSAGRNSA